LAITKVLSYEVAEIMRLRVIIVDNDAIACFDRMIEAPNNLACLQHRANQSTFNSTPKLNASCATT